MILSKAELCTPDQGQFIVRVNSASNQRPVENAVIDISRTDDPEHTVIAELKTNSLGITEEIDLSCPPLEYSLMSGSPSPYEKYTATIQAPGFRPVVIQGTQVIAENTSIQPVFMQPLDVDDVNGGIDNGVDDGADYSVNNGVNEGLNEGIDYSVDHNEGIGLIYIPDHTLYGAYPVKIAENEIKPVSDTGEIILSRVVLPQTIVVHDGRPTASAKNYYVPFTDYIQNVACSEIYPTWPKATIQANVLAILSSTLNRVYTEWYRNHGYPFTLTSSTAFDHKWSYGRNIFGRISGIVDEMFTNYLSRPNVRQPILAQYCDGRKVSFPNWMSQWDSKDLGEEGYSTLEIIRTFYGGDIYINSVEEISGIPGSWSGEQLAIASIGENVQQMQEQLNTLAIAYPDLPTLIEDGIYGEETAHAVKEFQNVFSLPPTGVTDFTTWYKMSQIYSEVTGII